VSGFCCHGLGVEAENGWGEGRAPTPAACRLSPCIPLMHHHHAKSWPHRERLICLIRRSNPSRAAPAATASARAVQIKGQYLDICRPLYPSYTLLFAVTWHILVRTLFGARLHQYTHTTDLRQATFTLVWFLSPATCRWSSPHNRWGGGRGRSGAGVPPLRRARY